MFFFYADPAARKQKKSAGGAPTYTQVFADALIGEAGRDESVVAVHAAMGGGTGLNHFEKFYAAGFESRRAEMYVRVCVCIHELVARVTTKKHRL